MAKNFEDLSPAYRRRLENFANKNLFLGANALENTEVRRAAVGHTARAPKTAEGAMLLALRAMRDPARYAEAFNDSDAAQAAAIRLIQNERETVDDAFAQGRKRGGLDIPLVIFERIEMVLGPPSETGDSTPRPRQSPDLGALIEYYSDVPVMVTYWQDRDFIWHVLVAKTSL